jgi:hypothetical protein
MAESDRASCRRAAEECVALARITTDPDTKEILLTRAQEWLKLAYSDHDAEFEGLLAEFNEHQMGFEQAAAAAEGAKMQRQPMQQQQSRALDEGKEE